MRINNLKAKIEEKLSKSLHDLFSNISLKIELQQTREDFDGDYTLVVFPFTKALRKKPEDIAKEIGDFLVKTTDWVLEYNVVKGFLNLSIKEDMFFQVLDQNINLPIDENAEAVMVEYSSPNTNKPLHLGHVRNNLLGYSISKIIEASGKKLIKAQLVNDRGIHICKSMVAWQEFAEGKTPDSENQKGDHFVGKYYVAFDKKYKEEIAVLVKEGKSEEEAKKNSPIFKKAQETLKKWEAGDKETLSLWKEMNEWVYAGFNKTYDRLGVSFDVNQYESETYLLGKSLVNKGLDKKLFYKKEDNSIWCDLKENGLDEKLLLRSDGTSVYMTQDIGTAVERLEKFDIDKLIYTVGDEQDYHFKVLFTILDKLGFDSKEKLKHLSYAMVDLPDGKMKSREGNVVDADDLLSEMHETAKQIALERGKLEELTDEEKDNLYETVGLGALKYFILKIDPKKRILFNPKESVDFQGNTGPFIQYTYARIQSLLDKTEYTSLEKQEYPKEIGEKEKSILVLLDEYYPTLNKAAEELNPSLIANYVFDLVKTYNNFYQSVSILKSKEGAKYFRLLLSDNVAETIKKCLSLLGINVVKKM